MKRQPARSAAPRSSLAPEMPRMLPTITVVIPRNVLPQLTQKIFLLDAPWPHERAEMVPVRTVQRHHRPIPTEADDMSVLAQLDEIGQLHRALADLQGLIHVERVHSNHSGFLEPQRGYHIPFWKPSRPR